MSSDPSDPCVESPHLRLQIAAEQLRLASTAIARLATLVDDQDSMLTPHVERLECRAVELMRTAGRLAREMGVAGRWGIDILFSVVEPAAPARSAPSGESIELEPIELLRPIDVPPPVVRSGSTRPPWSPGIILPTPPLASMVEADESTC